MSKSPVYRKTTEPIPVNYVINGNMDFSQRGESFAGLGPSAASIYTLDRWLMRSTGTNGVVTVARQVATPGEFEAVSDFESKYYLRWDQTVSTSADQPRIVTRIEDVETLAGKTVTVSYLCKMDVARDIRTRLQQTFGSGGSSAVVLSYQVTNVGTSWQRVTHTFDIPSISGKTVGTDSYLELSIAFTESNVASGTFTADIAQVMVHEGELQNFQRAGRNIQDEFAMCSRYYQRYEYDAQNSPIGTAFNDSGAFCFATFMLHTPLRALTPDVEISDVADLAQWTRAGGKLTSFTDITVFSGAISPTTLNAFPYIRLRFTRTGGFTTFGPATVITNANDMYLAFSAEL